MKKLSKTFAVLSAVALILSGSMFVSCSDSDDGDNTTQAPAGDSQNQTTPAATVTTDSWDFVTTSTDSKQSVIGKTFTGWMWAKNSSAPKNVYIKATTSESKILDAKQSTVFSDLNGKTDAKYSDIYNVLKENMTVDGASGNYTLTIANYAGTGVGTTTVGTSAAEPTEKSGTDTDEPKALGFKAKSDTGLLIKKDALKIAGVKGAVKLTVNWYMASAKAANERNLEVTIGSDGTTAETGCSSSKGDQTPYTVSFDGGETGKDVYIGASNEILIKSIKIEAQ